MVQAKGLIRSHLLPIGEPLTVDPGSTAAAKCALLLLEDPVTVIVCL